MTVKPAASGKLFIIAAPSGAGKTSLVHELIDRLHEAAVALVSDPGAQQFAATCDIFKALEQTVRSHFSYEETELAEAIGVHLDFI